MRGFKEPELDGWVTYRPLDVLRVQQRLQRATRHLSGDAVIEDIQRLILRDASALDIANRPNGKVRSCANQDFTRPTGLTSRRSARRHQRITIDRENTMATAAS